MVKRRIGSQNVNLTPITKSQEFPWFTCVQVVCHIYFWKALDEGYNFAMISPQLEVYTRSYGPPKSWESQFWEFQDQLGRVLGQNDIWMQPLWLNIENIIRGKVVVSHKFGPWWILWVHVWLWFVRAPKMFQLHTNQLFVWFVQVHVNNWPACHSS